MRFFASGFFHESSSSPKPEKITLGSFGLFLKILGDIRKSRCTSTTPVANLATVTAGVVDTGGKFATGVNYMGDKYQTADILK